MKQLILYSTLGCHLCEQALELILPLLNDACMVNVVDISDSDDLMDRYSTRIPVVARSDNHTEIAWPFNTKQFVDFVR
jgi:hypothetical protein